MLASLIETCKLNGVNPEAYFTDVLTKLVNNWPNRRLAELLPWAWTRRSTLIRQAPIATVQKLRLRLNKPSRMRSVPADRGDEYDAATTADADAVGLGRGGRTLDNASAMRYCACFRARTRTRWVGRRRRAWRQESYSISDACS